MENIITNLMEDVVYLDKKYIKYEKGLEKMTEDNLPLCFNPIVDAQKLKEIIICMDCLINRIITVIREDTNEKDTV